MVFSKKKKTGDSLNIAELNKKLRQCDTEKEFYNNTIRSLLILLKNFPLDLKEIDTPGFARHIEELSNKIIEDNSLSKTRSFVEKSKKIISSFINRHKAVLGERESEFKEIIELLTRFYKPVNLTS